MLSIQFDFTFDVYFLIPLPYIVMGIFANEFLFTTISFVIFLIMLCREKTVKTKKDFKKTFEIIDAENCMSKFSKRNIQGPKKSITFEDSKEEKEEPILIS